MLLLPPRRGMPDYMGHLHPFAFGARGVQAVSPDILRSARRNVLRELQEETCHRKGLGFSLEEVVVGGVGYHRGFAVLLDAYLLQR